MKRLIGFFAISGLLVASNLDSCVYLHEEWHNENPAKVNNHHSPTPEHNIAAPTEEGSSVREIKDTFSQEDHSDRDGNGNNQVLTDQPLEEHLEEMVECDDSGTVDEDYPTLPCDKALHYDTRSGFNPGQKLEREDVFGDGTGENHYTIKNTSGMIYKTDQLTCDTAYDHPTTGFTSGKSGEETNHNYVTNDAGELSTNSDDKYCFYLLIPGNGHSPGKVARVDDNDENSKREILNGNVPYLPLDEEYKNRLETGAEDLSFVNGRYIAAMPEGKMLVPTNGSNLLFNRTTVYRPYMQDVWRREQGGVSELQDLDMLDGTTFDAANEGADKSEFFKLGDGIGSRMTGLDHKTSLVTKPSSDTNGQKLSGWGDRMEGDPYLAIGPAGDPSKELNIALHFPNNETEREYLEKVTDGSFEPNETRTEIPTDRGHKLLNLEERQKMLSDAVKFQMLVGNNYTGDGNEASFDPNLLKDKPVTTCDEADEQTQVFCVKYKPLRDSLVNVYNQLGIENGEGATEALQAKLSGPLNSNFAVGGHNWKVSDARAAIGQFENNNKTLLDDVDFDNPGSDGNAFPSGFGTYINKTEEGIMQKTMLLRLQTSWMVDAEKVSQANLIDGKEHQYFNDEAQANKSKSDDVLKQKLTSIASTRYQQFETNNVTKGAFLHYTTQNPEGRQLLTKLGLIQRGTNTPNETSGVVWQAHVPESLFGRCRVNTAVEDCRSILTGDEIAPEATLESLNNRFDPLGSPLPLEPMP